MRLHHLSYSLVMLLSFSTRVCKDEVPVGVCVHSRQCDKVAETQYTHLRNLCNVHDTPDVNIRVTLLSDKESLPTRCMSFAKCREACFV